MRQIKNDYSLESMLERTNPLQEKYFDLTRQADESIAKELRPNPQEQERINHIITLPDFLVMSDQDKAIIWRYRYSLIENGRALGKFLQSARFQVENELKETMRILKRWSQIELEDALPLLSIKFAANAIYKEEILHDRQLVKVYNEIRKRAVNCLEK